MVFPFLQPFFAGDSPNNGIIFNFIPVIQIQRAHRRTQIAQNAPLFQIFQSCLQGTEQGLHGAHTQHIIRTGQIQRDPTAPEHQPQLGAEGSGIGANHHHIPISSPVSGNGPNLLRHSHTSLVYRICHSQRNLRSLAQLRQLSFKNPPTNLGQQRIIRPDRLDLRFHTGMFGQVCDLLRRLSRLFIAKGIGSRTVAGQAHGHIGRITDQMLQNCHVLPGKIRESIHIEGVPLRKVAVPQLVQHPIHLITGIPLSLGAQRVIAFHQQGQFFQFLGKGTFHHPRGSH